MLLLYCFGYIHAATDQHTRSRGSSASIVSVRSPTEAEDFSSSLCIQTSSGAQPASCSMDTRGPFPRGKARPGRDADHSPPSTAEIKNE
jgi:hypothetical protein